MRSRFLSIVVALGVLCMCLFVSIDFHAFNKTYYRSSYAKLETAASIGMSEEGLNRATFTLLDYIKDERDDLDCREEVHGRVVEVFNEREKLHMVDVKDLYLNVRCFCVWMGVVSLLGVGLYFWLCKGDLLRVVFDLKYGFTQVVVSFLMVVGCLLFYALVDFDRFWTVFHEIFFRNDLWLLDPNTSIMINMFPLEFFFGMVMRIALTFIVLFSIIYGIVYYLSKYLGGSKYEKSNTSE